jgi:hypothetical protein
MNLLRQGIARCAVNFVPLFPGERDIGTLADIGKTVCICCACDNLHVRRVAEYPRDSDRAVCNAVFRRYPADTVV